MISADFASLDPAPTQTPWTLPELNVALPELSGDGWSCASVGLS